MQHLNSQERSSYEFLQGMGFGEDLCLLGALYSHVPQVAVEFALGSGEQQVQFQQSLMNLADVVASERRSRTLTQQSSKKSSEKDVEDNDGGSESLKDSNSSQEGGSRSKSTTIISGPDCPRLTAARLLRKNNYSIDRATAMLLTYGETGSRRFQTRNESSRSQRKTERKQKDASSADDDPSMYTLTDEEKKLPAATATVEQIRSQELVHRAVWLGDRASLKVFGKRVRAVRRAIKQHSAHLLEQEAKKREKSGEEKGAEEGDSKTPDGENKVSENEASDGVANRKDGTDLQEQSTESEETVSDTQDSPDINEEEEHILDMPSNRGETPLCLAFRREDYRMVNYLLSIGCNPAARTPQGWSVFHEACFYNIPHVATDLRLHAVTFKQKMWERNLPRMRARLCDIPDFSVEIQWKIQSWIPMVGRLAPSDTFRIWKSGGSLRFDSNLRGMDGMKAIKGLRSLLFNKDSVWLVDHVTKTAADALHKFRNPSYLEVEQHVKSTIEQGDVVSTMDTSKVAIRGKTRFLIGGFKTGKVDGYKCVQAEMTGLALRITELDGQFDRARKRARKRMKQKKKSKEKNQDGGESNEKSGKSAPGMHSSSRIVDSSDLRETDEITGGVLPYGVEYQVYDIYFADENEEDLPMGRKLPSKVPKDVESTDNEEQSSNSSSEKSSVERKGGAEDSSFAPGISVERKSLSTGLWICDNYPLQFDHLKDILNIIAPINSNIAKVCDIINVKFPPYLKGFPMKLEIPVASQVYAVVSFANYSEGRQKDEIFEIPEGFRRRGL